VIFSASVMCVLYIWGRGEISVEVLNSVKFFALPGGATGVIYYPWSEIVLSEN